MKRRIETCTLMILIACSLFIDYIARQKTWRYPDLDVIFNSEKARIWLTELVLAGIIATCVCLIAKFICKSLKITIAFTMTIIICICVYSFYRYPFNSSYAVWVLIRETQKFITATYFPISFLIAYGLSKLLTNKLISGSLSFVIHFCILFFTSWVPHFHEIALSPALIIYMVTAFMLAFICVFRNDDWSPMQAAAYSAISIAIQTAAFSYSRLTTIIDNMFSTNTVTLAYNENWILYRKKIMDSMISGIPKSDISPYALSEVPNYHFVWLGISYNSKLHLIYIIIFIAVVFMLTYMLITENFGRFTRFLIISCIAQSIWGLICELLLFYSADLGILFGHNVFQLVPLVLLLYCINKRPSRSPE